MNIIPFELERYFAKYEFSTRYLLSSSDCNGLPMARVLGYADAQTRELWEGLTLSYTERTIRPSARPRPRRSSPSSVLRARDRIIPDHLARIQRNLRLLDRFFERHSDLLSWVRPKAGTIGFARLLSREGADEFCQRVIREAEIMLLPSTVYGFGNRHLRIGFGRENLPEVLEVLDRYLTKTA